jgi:transmembrane sensor
MSDDQQLMQRIASAGTHIDPGLSDRDVERLVAGSRRKRRRRTVVRFASATVAGCAGVAVLLVFLHHRPQPATPVVAQQSVSIPAPVPAADRTLRFSDGSLAIPLDVASKIEVAEESPTRIGLRLLQGHGHFEVTPRPQRTFSVRAGDVTVTVVGTVFTVERVADRVGVAVERGTVRVDWGVGVRLLRKGESGWFPPLVVDAPKVARHVPSLPAPTSKSLATVHPSGDQPAPALARREQTAEELLLVADAARLAGHPDEGALALRRLLRDHRTDPRAPLAAFTLGRMLLMELGRPREAAAAFAQVRQLSPRGPFAEDALAREVEAWSQAGQSDLARERAQEYLQIYPGGRRTPSVRSMGGIE